MIDNQYPIGGSVHTESYDYIKPKHYELWEGFDSLSIHKALLTKEELIGFYKGNILKYQMRIGRKPNAPVNQDLEKIKTYEQFLKEILSE
jgi:hypothetical protein